MTKLTISIFGSTGSVGKTTLNIITGPSVINGTSATFNPAFQLWIIVSEITTVINGPGLIPSITPNVIAAMNKADALVTSTTFAKLQVHLNSTVF